jgi:dCMP deaminase
MPERERPSLDEMYLRMAEVAAQRSTCGRLQVGAIITNQDRSSVLSVGYNGSAHGMPNGCLRDEPGNCGCVLHAEENALLKAPHDRGDLVLYTTHSPCLACSYRIIQSRVRRVVCRSEYRSLDGVVLLRSRGIPVDSLPALP